METKSETTQGRDSVSGRKFYWTWLSGTLEVIIPKKRGKGFLKIPAGHHKTGRIDALEDIGNCDISGLDGTLSFWCGTHISVYTDKQEEFMKKVFPVISEQFECEPGEEVSWEKLHELMKAH